MHYMLRLDQKTDMPSGVRGVHRIDHPEVVANQMLPVTKGLVTHLNISPTFTLFGNDFVNPIGNDLYTLHELRWINMLVLHCDGTDLK